jgi:hypothetical protein
MSGLAVEMASLLVENDVFYSAEFSLSVDLKTAFLQETTLEKDATTPFSALCLQTTTL